MELIFLLKGFIIGFSIGMAVGPIALLCIRNSLTKGFMQGFATGLGAAVADSIFGAIAGFGLVAISGFLVSYRAVLQIAGGLFLCYLGLDMFRAKKSAERKEIASSSCWTIFATTVFLTMTNPLTIVSFIAIYAGLGAVSGQNSFLSATLLTGGIFLGSIIWYSILSWFVSSFKNRVTEKGNKWLSRISGGIILGFGIASLVSALHV